MDELLQAFPLRTCTRHKFDYHQRIGPALPALRHRQVLGALRRPRRRRGLPPPARLLGSRSSRATSRPLTDLLDEQMEAAAARAALRGGGAGARRPGRARARAATEQVVVLDDHSNLDVVAVATDGARAAVVRFVVRHGRVIGRTVHLVDRSMDESERRDPRGRRRPSSTRPAPRSRRSWSPSPRRRPVGRVPRRAARAPGRGGDPAARPAPPGPRDGGRRRRRGDRAATRCAARPTTTCAAGPCSSSAQALGLAQPPYRIECFDMSHLQGTNYVGSMVVFEDGLAREARLPALQRARGAGQRRRRRDGRGAFDRRLAHWDDGHRDVQVPPARPDHRRRRAAPAARRPARRRRGRGRRRWSSRRWPSARSSCTAPGRSHPIALERGSEALYLVQRVRDEAHRFAITFHRSKRGRSMVASSLEGVEGLGPSRREGCWRASARSTRCARATLEELARSPWLPRRRRGQRLYDHLERRARPGAAQGG